MSQTKVYAIRRNYLDSDFPSAIFHEPDAPDREARFAMAIMERWAMAAGKDDGEDSAGRSKIALMPVREVVTRACDLAEQAYAEFRNRGWLINLPSLDEMEQEIQERENKKKNGGPRWG